MTRRCAFCGAEGVGISLTCPPCVTRRVDESRAAQGLPLEPPAAALRLVASIAHRTGKAAS